jgi:hypothetical protein
MKKRKDSAQQPIVLLLLLLCLLLLILALLLGYFVFRPAAISGTVFDDRNGDGIQQQREAGLAERVVRLVDAAGKEVKRMKTERDGGYRFDGLGVGTYRVALANTSAERKVKITRRGEVMGIDLGVPPLEPRDQNELRRNHDFWAKKNGGDEDTEKAVDRALEWLANHQLGDGGWTFNLGDCPRCRGQCRDSGDRKDRTAATALALLPFLGRGISHDNSDPADAIYQRTVARGLAFLQNRVADDGKVTEGEEVWTMYSQGLAGIVFAEMCDIVAWDQRNAGAKDPKQPANPNEEPFDNESLRKNATLVLRFICRAQDPEGGGWRYEPRQPGDISVAGWQMMALHAGKKNVPNAPGTWQKAIKFLDSVQADEGAAYGYMAKRMYSSKKRPDATTTSAVGLLCRMYDGWPKEHPPLIDGVGRLAKVGPTQDLYFDYYATQVMFHMGGEPWKTWNQRMKKLLLDTQRQPEHGHEAGSWFEGVNEGLLDKRGGRLYCTSLAAMILEVYHRHLRIYRPRD